MAMAIEIGTAVHPRKARLNIAYPPAIGIASNGFAASAKDVESAKPFVYPTKSNRYQQHQWLKSAMRVPTVTNRMVLQSALRSIEK